MKKIRIGNDIRIEWTLLRNGEAESLSGRDVTVLLIHDMSKAVVPFVWTCSENKVVGTFYGKDQENTGRYSLVFVENSGRPDMHTLDRAEAFGLVDRSWKANGDDGDDGCERLTVCETVELSDDLEYARDGRSAYEIAVLHGYAGTEAEWIAEQQAAISMADQAINNANQAKRVADKAHDDIDKTTMRVYRDGGYNMNQCLWYGHYFGCTLGRPSGSSEDVQYALEVVNCGTKIRYPEGSVDVLSRYPQLGRIGTDGGWQGTFGYYQIPDWNLIRQFVERYYGNYPAEGEEICSVVLTDVPQGIYNLSIFVAASSTEERDTWLPPANTEDVAFVLEVNGKRSDNGGWSADWHGDGSPHKYQSLVRTSIPYMVDSMGKYRADVEVGSDRKLVLKLFAGKPQTANWYVLYVDSLTARLGEEYMVIKQTCHSNIDAKKVYQRLIYTKDRNVFEPPTTIYQEWQVIDNKNVFVAEYGVTTGSEIEAALAAGKTVLCNKNGLTYMLSGNTTNWLYFTTISAGVEVFSLTFYKPSGVWGTGVNTGERTSNKVTSLSASSTDAQYPSAKCVADMVAVWGVVSQTQTWTKASDGGCDYVMSNLQYGWIPKMFVDLVTTAGAIFNATSGYFELNGLTDLSYEEMRVIYNDTPRTARRLNRLFGWFKGRTNLPFVFTDTDGMIADPVNNLFEDMQFVNGLAGSNLEVFNIPCTTVQVASYTANFRNIASFLHKADYLHELKHPFIITGNISNIAFGDAVSLQEISIRQLNANIPFTKCSRLSVASILYMIQNEAATSAIIITLHATAYARAMADSDIQEALENHPNVSLASA